MNRKKILKVVVICLVCIGVYIPYSYTLQNFQNIDPDSKHLITYGIMSGIGISFYITRNSKKYQEDKNRNTKEYFESMELLFLMIIPTLDVFGFLMKYQATQFWGILLYFGVITGWFLIVTRPKEDQKQNRRGFFINITYWWAVLVVIGILGTWLLVRLLAIQQGHL